MIKEIISYLTQKSLPEARAFGHLYESISLVEKEKRCHEAWRSHRDHSKQFIISQCLTLSHFDHLLILGSGPLHEIPIEWLSQKFKKVTLLDVVHLHQVKKEYRHLLNVEFVEHDLTEVEAELLNYDRLLKKVPTFMTDQKLSMVISANVMSQLPLHFQNYIEKKRKKKFTQKMLDDFLEELTRSHVAYLRSFNAKVILITDTEKYYLNAQGDILEKEFNYPHLNLPLPVQEWMWSVAPLGELGSDLELKMKVSGFVLKK